MYDARFSCPCLMLQLTCIVIDTNAKFATYRQRLHIRKLLRLRGKQQAAMQIPRRPHRYFPGMLLSRANRPPSGFWGLCALHFAAFWCVCICICGIASARAGAFVHARRRMQGQMHNKVHLRGVYRKGSSGKIALTPGPRHWW